MEYTSLQLVDTSLDLNSKPLRFLSENPTMMKQEVQSNFIDFGMNMGVKDEAGALVEELNRVSAENRKLTEMLTVMCENYNALQNHLADYMSKNPAESNTNTSGSDRKRKPENNGAGGAGAIVNERGQSESSSSDEDSCKKPRQDTSHLKSKTSRVCVRTEASDTSLVVKDGYQWRKYGQKVTRDNPSPRAYFKCSFAPTCPVKKKVQRSVEDQSVLVATYEGEHNHPHPSRHDQPSNRSSLGSVPCTTSLGSSGPTITLDLTAAPQPNQRHSSPKPSPTMTSSMTTAEAAKQQVNGGASSRRLDTPEFQQFLVDQMANSLTKDPSFKAALAAAISGRILQQNQTQKW